MPAPPPLFPSPRGDKLCRLVASAQHQLVLFPSPRGDKLCQMTAEDLISTYEFPSPRGDKLCRVVNLWSKEG